MSKTHNYLRSNRKRLELSLEEVDFLLGGHDFSKISKHEIRSVEPSLKTALAYEAIYQRPIRELFAGLYQQAEREVAARAKILTHRLERGDSPRRSVRRRQAFAEIAALRSPKPLINETDDTN
jgi:transcriptional regulator with XRE-family HTH domain